MGAHMRRVGDHAECWLQVSPEICHHDVPFAATLVMLVDVGAGWAAEMASGDDWSFTVDIGIRRDPTGTGRITGTPVVQRAGRTISVDLPMVDDDGNATATGVSTFVRLARREQDPPRPHFPSDSMSVWQPPDAPLVDLLAAQPTAHGLQVDHRRDLLNPAGILQGGVAALLAELAALRQLEASGRSLVATSFDVRYITMGRVGPFEAIVEPIGDDNAVVKVHDRGADDAIVTHNLIGFTAV